MAVNMQVKPCVDFHRVHMVHVVRLVHAWKLMSALRPGDKSCSLQPATTLKFILLSQARTLGLDSFDAGRVSCVQPALTSGTDGDYLVSEACSI